jgi:site-specific DNA-methyltransferase (adenine-specific)/modification methylase
MNKIFNEDNIETMKRFNDKSIDGIITSPPYNITTKRKDVYYKNGYSDIDNLSEEDYIKKRLNEFKEFERILTPKGVICYNISYHNQNPILPTLLMTEIHNKTELTVADIITWKKKTSIPFQTSPTKLSRICELIYIIVKKEHLHDFETNKEVSSINKKTNQKFYKNYQNLIEANNNDGIKSKLKAAYSEELVLKLINIYFKPNTTIYDPFSGIGTTSRACKKSNINSFASELDKELYDLSIKLIK